MQSNIIESHMAILKISVFFTWKKNLFLFPANEIIARVDFRTFSPNVQIL